MDSRNSQPQTLRQNNRRTMPLYRMVTFIFCLFLLLGGRIPITTEANHHPSLAAPQPSTPAEVNRIERAATPRAFRSISLSNNPGTANLNLNGQIILGEGSDSLDPARDRLVIALGPSLTVLEPGSLRPSGQSNRVWTYQNTSHPRIRKVILQRHTDESWQFEISSRASMPENKRFYLRIGNDWGGINLQTGGMLLQMQPALNFAFQSQATIGSAGGTVQATDASGIVISLSIPAGALAEERLITVTPLESSLLVAPSGALHPGVKFEPEGLQFANPATLTLDFSATGQQITNKDFIFLMTSPMTMVPLYGSANPATKTLTSLIHHFSEVQPGPGGAAFSDLAAWASAVLSSGQNLTLSEIQSLAAVAAVQLQQGCEQNCIDVAQLAERVRQSITATVSSQCPLDTANPSDQALNRYLQLETIAQQFGVEVTGIRGCIEQILRALIERDGAAAIANPSYSTTLPRILELANRAQQLGFAELETLALQKVDAAMRVISQRLLGNVQQARGTDQEQAVTDQSRTELEGALSFVQTTGAAVLTVAPSLDDDLRAAIETLTPAAMRVTVLRALSGGPFVRKTYAFAGAAGVNQYSYLAADSPLPVSLSSDIPQEQVRWALRSTGSNSFAWDLDVSTAGGYVSANAMVELSFTRAGTLTFEANPEWRTVKGGSDCPANPAACEVVFATTNLNSWPPTVALAYRFGVISDGVIMLMPGFPIHTGVRSVVPIPGPTTVNYLLGAGQMAGGSAGRGRILTVTFTPQQ